MMSKVFCLFLLLLAACGEKVTHSSVGTEEASLVFPSIPKDGICRIVQGEHPDYLQNLGCMNDFESLQGVPDISVYSGVKSVKYVYRIEDSTSYFPTSERYPLHFDFADQVLGFDLGHAQFDQLQYRSNTDRLYHLATLNYYEEQKIFTLEFSPTDPVTVEQFRFIYSDIRSRVWFGSVLHFFPRSATHQSWVKDLDDSIIVVQADEIFAEQQVQILNPGLAYGALVFRSAAELQKIPPARGDLVVSNGLPNDIPAVAGIITTDFQTPLSHINVLSANRGTPNLAYRNAWQDSFLRSLENHLVRFEVRRDGWTVAEASASAAEAFVDSLRPGETLVLERDDSTEGLFDMTEVSLENIDRVGAKAANFSELVRASENLPGLFRTPESAFAIPFYYYRKHMEKESLAFLLQNILQDEKMKTDALYAKNRLSELRNAILVAPVDDSLLVLIEKKVVAQGREYSRFRSSTNAEDIEGFNGAGLYASATGDLGKGSVEGAIRKVWASLWGDRAWAEREWFRIDQTSVSMGVLVHRSFPDKEEQANGVALTSHMARPDYPAFTVNVQQGAVSVVSPPAGVRSEQLFFYMLKEEPYTEPDVEYLSRSSWFGVDEVLSLGELSHLARSLMEVKQHFYALEQGRSGFWAFALDVEFKFVGEQRKLYLKQVRPFSAF